MKRFLKEILKVTIVSFIMAVLFGSYFYLIGIPKTQARTFYNVAKLDIEKGNIQSARANLKKALSYWNEGYIFQTLKDLN